MLPLSDVYKDFLE